MIQLDFSSAFILFHTLGSQTLSYFNLEDQLILWILDFLTHRPQRALNTIIPTLIYDIHLLAPLRAVSSLCSSLFYILMTVHSLILTHHFGQAC